MQRRPTKLSSDDRLLLLLSSSNVVAVVSSHWAAWRAAQRRASCTSALGKLEYPSIVTTSHPSHDDASVLNSSTTTTHLSPDTEEVKHVVSKAAPRIVRSGVVDTETGGSAISDIRTSSGMFFERGEDAVIARESRSISTM